MFIRTVFRDLSIKYKIILSFYCIVILFSVIIGFYFYKVYETNAVNKISIANLGIVRQIDSNIDFLQNEIEDTSNQLVLDTTIQSSLKKNTNTLYMDYSEIATFISKSYISLTILYSLNDSITPFYISNDNSNGIYPFNNIEKSDIYKEILTQKGKPVWFPVKSRNQAFIVNNNNPKIAMARMVRDEAKFNNIGLLIICVNEQTIENIYADSLQANKGSIAIVDGQGNIISQSGPDFYQSAKNDQNFIKETSNNSEYCFVDNISGKDLLISYSANNSEGWKLYYAVPMSNLTKEVNSILLFILLIIFGCFIIFFPLLNMISSVITAPIKKLLKSMKNFQEGNFNEYVEINSSDEIGQLEKGYNSMVRNIKQLINEAYILQIKERDAELNALQAQINPHFLYNTLDTIYWKAKIRGEEEISQLIYSLSRLFRLSLNRGKEMTLVSSEKEFMEHYLLLQKMRFKNKLNYEILLDTEILNFVIPKLIIQPFVENSIIHGIEKKKEGGTITVTGSKEGEKLRFTIKDDGAGMKDKEMKELLSLKIEDPINTSVSSGGYAVRNIVERLKLMYKDDYSISFTSKPGSGTFVEILIPAVEYSKKQET
jgi:two-component system sensor histidine kinase YesM